MSAKVDGEENPGEPGLPGDWGVAESFQGAERNPARIAATRHRPKKKERVPWNALFGAEWLSCAWCVPAPFPEPTSCRASHPCWRTRMLCTPWQNSQYPGTVVELNIGSQNLSENRESVESASRIA
jgi:hypothetical protein